MPGPKPIKKRVVGIYKMTEDATIPTLAYEGDVGYDLYALEDVDIPFGTVKTISTGICLSLPKDMFAQINTRSSFGKEGLYAHHGVIDSGYTGEITVWMMNIAGTVESNNMIHKDSYAISKGDKIGQLLFHKAETPTLKVIKKLSKTARGDKGHGSSGK